MNSLARDDFTLGNLLRSAADRQGDRVFIETGDASRTFFEAHLAANRTANGMAELGVDRASKVAIMAANSIAFVDAWLGIARAGAVYIPINTEYKGDILGYQLAKADVTHIVIDPSLIERLDAVIAGLPQLQSFLLDDGSLNWGREHLPRIKELLLAEQGRSGRKA